MLRFLFLLFAGFSIIGLIHLSACDGELLSPGPSDSDTIGDTMFDARLTIDNPDFDFGLTPQNSVVIHSFWLRSTGTDTVRMLSILTG